MQSQQKGSALRIGLVGPLPPPFGGMANQMKQLSKLLRKEGVEVRIVQTNADYWPKAVGRFRRVRAFFRLVPYVLRLWRLAAQVDVIHVLANSGWSWQLFATPAIWIGQLRNIPVVVNYRGGKAKNYFGRAIARVRPTMSRGAALIVPSPYLREVFAEFGFKAAVIPNIIDLERFHPADRRDSEKGQGPHLVITRNLEPIYDIGTAIRAVAQIAPKMPGLRVSIAGSGPQEKELKALASKLDLDQVIDFIGRLPPEAVAELYRSADLMLNPTTVDNMPNSILEAMASGIPIVTTNVGGIPHVVRDEETALFVAPGDAEGMAAQVRRVLSEEGLRERLVTNGLTEVRQYAWPEVRARWLECYRKVAGIVQPGETPRPRLVVFSTLFPHTGAPNAGVFVRERMYRVGQHLPITVVSPKPWFPGQSLIRRFRSGLRPKAAKREVQQGVEVILPRFFSFPVILKQFDGLFLALGAYPTLKRLKRRFALDVLDSHFTYPDGYAAVLLGRWLKVPVTITLRGTEVPHSRNPKLRSRLVAALEGADHIFSVSESLRQHAISLGADPGRVEVVGNGVDIEKFHPEDRDEARRLFSLPPDARVMISVGALVPRKGMQRVIELMPELLETFPKLHYVLVGGGSPEGDIQAELEQQIASLQLEERVHLLGSMPSEKIRWPLSAADIFVLSTSNEGWANVFLEAMACGLPVVTTDVGGNAEVVCRPELGSVVPFGDPEALRVALEEALAKEWDRSSILAYAQDNRWESRVELLQQRFEALALAHTPSTPLFPQTESSEPQ